MSLISPFFRSLITKNVTNSKFFPLAVRNVSSRFIQDSARGITTPSVLPGLVQQIVQEPFKVNPNPYGLPGASTTISELPLWCPPSSVNGGGDQPILLDGCGGSKSKYKRKYKKCKCKLKKCKKKRKKCKKKRKKLKKKRKKLKKKRKKCKKKLKRCKRKLKKYKCKSRGGLAGFFK